MAYALVRVRGHPGVNKDIEDTLSMLNLTRANHCVVVPETKTVRGMINKVNNYITWGEMNEETLARLIKFRGKLKGDKPVDDSYVAENSEYSSIISLAKGIAGGEVKYSQVKDVKPLFRLSPPNKGYEGIKRSYREGGALGYRGEDINELIERMI